MHVGVSFGLFLQQVLQLTVNTLYPRRCRQAEIALIRIKFIEHVHLK